MAWSQAQLEAGDPTVAVPVLSELVGEYPLVEPLTAALMRALYASGRSAESLDRYTTIRKQLVEELGVDPGAELRAVHQAILRSEPDHSGSVPDSVVARQARVVPAQLPADVLGFAGREEDLACLDALLAVAATQAPSAVVISAVSGGCPALPRLVSRRQDRNTILLWLLSQTRGARHVPAVDRL